MKKRFMKRLIIYRLQDRQKQNKNSLCVILDEDNVFSYVYYSGWQDSGMGGSISSLQFTESLPMAPRHFKNVKELNEKIQSILKTGVGTNRFAAIFSCGF